MLSRAVKTLEHNDIPPSERRLVIVYDSPNGYMDLSFPKDLKTLKIEVDQIQSLMEKGEVIYICEIVDIIEKLQSYEDIDEELDDMFMNSTHYCQHCWVLMEYDMSEDNWTCPRCFSYFFKDEIMTYERGWYDY